jgi:hypothetical protein
VLDMCVTSQHKVLAWGDNIAMRQGRNLKRKRFGIMYEVLLLLFICISVAALHYYSFS